MRCGVYVCFRWGLIVLSRAPPGGKSMLRVSSTLGNGCPSSLTTEHEDGNPPRAALEF